MYAKKDKQLKSNNRKIKGNQPKKMLVQNASMLVVDKKSHGAETGRKEKKLQKII
jgi:hypothetical protein